MKIFLPHALLLSSINEVMHTFSVKEKIIHHRVAESTEVLCVVPIGLSADGHNTSCPKGQNGRILTVICTP